MFDAWLSPEDLWWFYYPDLPKKNCGRIIQRVPPRSPAICQALLNVYGPSEWHTSKDFLRDSEYCLIQLFLGGRKAVSHNRINSFSLRDFPLRTNDLEELGLDAHHSACVMANAPAMLHRSAGVDDRGIKFVLGLEASEKAEEVTAELTRRAVRVWMLDFEQCSRQTPLGLHDDEWLSLLCKSFWANRPYLPRPGSCYPADKRLECIR
jgi:hypothetical protein